MDDTRFAVKELRRFICLKQRASANLAGVEQSHVADTASGPSTPDDLDDGTLATRRELAERSRRELEAAERNIARLKEQYTALAGIPSDYMTDLYVSDLHDDQLDAFLASGFAVPAY